MKKLLIICKNLNTAKQVVNNVTSNMENIRLIGIALNFSEARKIIEKNDPDVIITTNKNIFKFISDKFIIYYPKIVLITDSKTKKKIPYKDFLSIEYGQNFKYVSDTISNFIESSVDITKKEKAIKILSYFGFDFKLAGTNYLLDCILYANSYIGSYSFEKLKDLYLHVSKINNCSVNVIKWSIERTIKYLYNKCDDTTYEKLEKYCGVIYPQRITPKFIINYISNKLST